MTLEELDNALEKTGLDLKGNPADIEVRDKILALHGQSILNAKKQRCKDCWMKEHGKCTPNCRLYMDSDNPIEVSKAYLSNPNDISIFPFLYLYMIPVYEEVTGKKNTREKLFKEFKQKWKEEKGSIKGFPS